MDARCESQVNANEESTPKLTNAIAIYSILALGTYVATAILLRINLRPLRESRPRRQKHSVRRLGESLGRLPTRTSAHAEDVERIVCKLCALVGRNSTRNRKRSDDVDVRIGGCDKLGAATLPSGRARDYRTDSNGYPQPAPASKKTGFHMRGARQA